MLGDREAVVRELGRVDIHGALFVDVTVEYGDEVLESARLGDESVPEGLQVGERVVVVRAVNMIVGIRRP